MTIHGLFQSNLMDLYEMMKLGVLRKRKIYEYFKMMV